MADAVIEAATVGAIIFGIGCFVGAFIFYLGMSK